MTTARREVHSPAIWAFILIALGAIWLLFEANIFSSVNLVVLFRLWPIVLIAFGLELLFGRGSRSMSLLIGAGTVVLLLVLMVVGPALGLAPSAEIQTAQYNEPVGDAASAQMNLDLSVGRISVQALSDSNDLITADLRYLGEVNFSVQGTTQKHVTLSAKNNGGQWFDFLGAWLQTPDQYDNQLRWDIGLTPSIPLDLSFNGGVGTSTIDLSGLQLTRMSYNTGVGDSTITLPAGNYSVDLNGGVGNTSITFTEGAAVTASIDGGVGNITIDVPDHAPVHISSNGGLGNVSVPSNFTVDQRRQQRAGSQRHVGDRELRIGCRRRAHHHQLQRRGWQPDRPVNKRTENLVYQDVVSIQKEQDRGRK